MSKSKRGGKNRTNRERLAQWQERLAESNREFSTEVEKMNRREQLYQGDKTLTPIVEGDTAGTKATHVRNVIFEIIESQVNSNLPMPKVTPRRKEDERLAKIIENWIRNEKIGRAHV